MTELESAPAASVGDVQRAVVSDPDALRELCTPLGPRLGLLRVRSAHDWSCLARAVPHIGACPNLQAGMVVGIVSWVGRPLDGNWPIRLNRIRVYQGAGLVAAQFHGGSYLPDGTAFLETAHVAGLRAVLAVDVDGTIFCPD